MLPMPPTEIVVDGTDSGGKSPCVAALRQVFAAEQDTITCAPFRVQEVYDLWQHEPRRAASTIRSIMDGFRGDNATAKLIIWDRGWPTVWVSTTDPVARAAMLPFPDLTVLLLNSIDTTKSKVEKHGLRTIWVTDPVLVQRYHDAYHDLARQMSDGRVAAFFPDAGGRFDYATIVAYVCAKLKLPRG
jgi:thymidylate kinase